MSSDTPLTPPPYDPAGVPQFLHGNSDASSDDASYPSATVPPAVQPPQYPASQSLLGQYPVSPYGVQSYAAPRAQEPLAVVSLVFGILGIVLVLPFIGSIVAIVSGHVARARIRTTGSGGGGMAVTGLVLGYIALAFATVFTLIMILLVFLPAMAAVQEAVPR